MPNLYRQPPPPPRSNAETRALAGQLRRDPYWSRLTDALARAAEDADVLAAALEIVVRVDGADLDCDPRAIDWRVLADDLWA